MKDDIGRYPLAAGKRRGPSKAMQHTLLALGAGAFFSAAFIVLVPDVESSLVLELTATAVCLYLFVVFAALRLKRWRSRSRSTSKTRRRRSSRA